MDVDNPILEDAMETDPPPTPAPVPHRKSSSMDPDGDEQMGAGEELYDEEGDVEFAEGDEGNGEAEKHVDADGDITPAETEGGDQGYFEEEQEESGDVEVVEGKGFDEAGDGEPAVEEEKEGLAPSAQVTNTETDTALTTAPNAEGTVAEPPNNTAAAIDELQESQGNVAVGSADQTDGGEALPAAPVEEDGDQAGQSLGAEQNEAEAGISGVAQLGADERQPEYTEQLHAQEEGEEEEEEVDGVYQLLTYETLPPIMLHLPNAQRALFNPIVSEDGTSPPVWFGEKVQEFSEGTLTLLWSAIRGKLEGEGLGNEVDEMVIAEKLTDLKMGDVSSPIPHHGMGPADETRSRTSTLKT